MKNAQLKNLLLIAGISLFTSAFSMWGYSKWQNSQYAGMQDPNSVPFNYASFKDKDANGGPVDFTAAATAATPAVVHIKTVTKAKKAQGGQSQSDPFGDLFGDPFGNFFGGPGTRITPKQQASGSGVLISQDGYIVTNNHVVDGADDIKVTLADKKTYTAKVIGADANTDLAVIKIEGTKFPYIVYGNSDDVKLGQWVLAIGYPLNLDVTVTAGIVSAKARSIGLNKGEAPVDSYIQTDAAVNPGNSGGALVNTNGELIGINSAIASPTGSYAGYSYAIPVNIVKKTITDLIKYGAVQRGYLGIVYSPYQDNDQFKKQNNIKGDIDGVYVSDVASDGAAKAAGIQKGDIITKISGQTVTSPADLTGIISGYKPGDKVAVTYLRAGKTQTTTVTLKNSTGSAAALASGDAVQRLGGELVAIDQATAHKNNIRGGVEVKQVGNGLLSQTRMQAGFIIISANGQPVTKLADLKKILSSGSNVLELKGIYPGDQFLHGYRINLNSTPDSQDDDSDDDGF